MAMSIPSRRFVFLSAALAYLGLARRVQPSPGADHEQASSRKGAEPWKTLSSTLMADDPSNAWQALGPGNRLPVANHHETRSSSGAKMDEEISFLSLPAGEVQLPIAPAPADLREQRSKAFADLNGEKWPAPENDRLLRAARGETVDRPPKWMMRQAGRYLPEYLATMETTDFFTLCKTPQLACEVTLQPIRRYPTLDSMIIFSDILTIPDAMGMDAYMVEKKGPQFKFALETPADLDKLNMKVDVRESLGYVGDAVYLTRQRAENKIPVIGFSGAPWTLMGYMVEGGAGRSFDRAKKWIYQYPEASRKLLTTLRELVVEYLVMQYDSGAPLLIIFDTNCGELPPRVYEEFMVADLKYIAEEIKRQRPHALMAVFPKDGELAPFDDSAYDVVGVSWKTSPQQARAWVPSKTLQGNLDPQVLYSDPKDIKETVKKMVDGFGIDKYIANLGHGMLPTHPVEGPQAFIEAIDSAKRS